MCTAVAAAVNGGYLVTPHVVDKITDTNGNVVEEIGTNIRRQDVYKRQALQPRSFLMNWASSRCRLSGMA